MTRGIALETGKNQLVALLAAMFVLSFSFDFKGQHGGAMVQFVMAGANGLSFILLAARFRFALPGRGTAGFMWWTWAAFVATASASAWINAVSGERYLRVIYPVLLFMEGFLVAWWLSKDRGNAIRLVTFMTWAAVASLLFTAWWGFASTGLGMTHIRYQILSPLLPFLLAVVVHDLFLAGRRRLLALATLVVILIIISLAVTRGVLLVLAMISAAVLVAWISNVVRGALVVPRPVVRATFWAVTIGLVFVLGGLVIAPETMGRWIHRISGNTSGVTLWARVATTQDQWAQLISSTQSMLIGRGFGHSYHYAQQYHDLVVPAITPSTFRAAMWYPTEFMWITFLYYGGLVVGALAAIGLLLVVWRALRVLSLLMEEHLWRSRDLRPVWIGIFGAFGFLGLSFTGNPFIIRSAAMFWGLCLGLVFARYPAAIGLMVGRSNRSQGSQLRDSFAQFGKK